jgi:hypothetical protein
MPRNSAQLEAQDTGKPINQAASTSRAQTSERRPSGPDWRASNRTPTGSCGWLRRADARKAARSPRRHQRCSSGLSGTLRRALRRSVRLRRAAICLLPFCIARRDEQILQLGLSGALAGKDGCETRERPGERFDWRGGVPVNLCMRSAPRQKLLVSILFLCREVDWIGKPILPLDTRLIDITDCRF